MGIFQSDIIYHYMNTIFACSIANKLDYTNIQTALWGNWAETIQCVIITVQTACH